MGTPPKHPEIPKEQRCPRCGGRRRVNHSLCRKCAKKARQRRTARYYERLEQGLCPECGGKRDLDGIQCDRCRKANREASKKIPTSRKNRYQLNYTRRNKKRGVCATCGGSLDDKRYVHCSRCRQRVMRRYRQDPIGWKIRNITRGYIKDVPPVPLCPVCHLHHRSCESCGKFMHPEHGKTGCTWSCRCGVIVKLS